MSIKKVLASLELSPAQEDMRMLKKETKKFCVTLEQTLQQLRMQGEVFIGGSFAKNTLERRECYDIDIFVRFDWRYEQISDLLEKVVEKMCRSLKVSWSRVHGSRDYFQVKYNKSVVFEVIPVIRIKKPREARNVTDLSYFHVGYVKRKVDRKLAREIVIGKAFCRAQGFYGAESYIHGFSGYGLECLLIHYKSFEKMAHTLSQVKERLILDPAKHYKKKDDMLFSLSESKLQSPVILIDPTWKERNVLAALSHETFHKFQEALRAFLKKPSAAFFLPSRINEIELQRVALRQEAELLHLHFVTDKQTGDIAGTKLKKFAQFLGQEIEKYFHVMREEFVYEQQQSAEVYYIVHSKKEIVHRGPPANMKKHAKAFRKAHKHVFLKDGILYARILLFKTAKAFAQEWVKKHGKTLKEMDIIKIEIK